MTFSDSKGDRKRRWKEIDKQERRNRGPRGYFLWDGTIGEDYIKTLYRSWERGLDTTVFRHHKSKERK